MYNRYISNDPDAFGDFFTRVDEDSRVLPNIQKETRGKEQDTKLKQLFGKLKLDELGLFPLLVLALLLLEADEEERMIMLVLAAVLGI